MRKIALITWATSWIGYELSKVFAKNKINLVLVADNRARLKEVSDELTNVYDIIVRTIEIDLSKQDAASEVYSSIKKDNIDVEYLVNNAWFWDYWEFSNSDIGKITQMINLNIITLTYLTRLLLDDMLAKRSWKILNLWSIASFMPWPMMAVYYATKAYVLSFSNALAKEIAGTWITVTTLCPGLTHTWFQETANQYQSAETHTHKLQDSKDVAEFGFRSMMKWKMIAVHWMKNKFQTLSTKVLPTRTVLWMVNRRQRRVSEK